MSKNDEDAKYLAIGGLVFSLVGLFVLAIVMEPLAMVFGCMAISKSRNGTSSILGCVSIIIGAMGSLVAVLAIAMGL